MTKCNEKIYKFAKGEYINTTFFSGYRKEVMYKLIIAEQDGTIVGTVNPDHIRYRVSGPSIASYEENRESLAGESNKFYGMINDLSVILNKDGQFIITGSSNGAFTPPVIGRSNMTLTEYGEKLFSECLGNTLEYHAPADNSTDHSDDQASHETYNEPYPAMNLDIL